MAITDEYYELIVTARDALADLLDESEHDSWSSCRVAYGTLRDRLAAIDHDRERDAREDDTRARREQNIREHQEHSLRLHEAWTGKAREIRENAVLQAVGPDALVIREIVARLNADMPKDVKLYESHIRPLVKALSERGDLERIPAPRGGIKRFRYRRPAGLGGAIADLERAFHDGSEAVA